MPIPLAWDISTAPPVDPTIAIHVAGTDDIGQMAALQDEAQAIADVRMPHSGGCWRWLVHRSGSTQLVAERGGSIIATARQTPPDEGVVLGELAGSAEGLRAIVARRSTRRGQRSWSERRPPSTRSSTTSLRLRTLLNEPESGSTHGFRRWHPCWIIFGPCCSTDSAQPRSAATTRCCCRRGAVMSGSRSTTTSCRTSSLAVPSRRRSPRVGPAFHPMRWHRYCSARSALQGSSPVTATSCSAVSAN